MSIKPSWCILVTLTDVAISHFTKENMPIPKFGVGTFRLQGDVVKNSVRDALSVGYRVIDTAQIYGNEADIGEVLKDSSITRDQLFITTKIWTENLAEGKLIPSLRESLQKLNTSFVDLTLIHWPSPHNEVAVDVYMQQLLEAKKLGLTRQIGVSNFTVDLMKQAIAAVGASEIATNQVELSPYLQNRSVVEFAKAHYIPVTSYMTLAYGKVLKDEVIHQIAVKHNATAAQVVLAWAMQSGYSVIPSSTKRDHLASNLLAQQLRLTDEDMMQIATLECGDRLVNPEGLAPEWD